MRQRMTGRVLLVGRLAARDLRYRPVQALLLLVVIAAAMSALTLGLLVHGVSIGIVQNGGPQGSPPAWWLIAMVAGMLVAVVGLTAIPARVGARRPPAAILAAEAP